MSAKLYTTTDSNELSQVLQDVTIHEKYNQYHDELKNSVSDIFTNNTVHRRIEDNDVIFTVGKGTLIYNIDSTIFTPNHIALLSPRKFEELYLQQLEGYIFNLKENLEVKELFSIITIYEYVSKGYLPIKITSNKNKQLIPKIVRTLNTFYKDNKTVISGIYTMFNGTYESNEAVDG